MQIKALELQFSVCKVEDYSQVDLVADFVFLSKTDEENSLILPTELVPTNTIEREDDWSAFRIQGVLDFSLIGILAKIAGLLAEEKISIIALSTFNTDYVLVKSDQFESALNLLDKAGYHILK
ncbi:ACT domain-containing protein [Streptococcus loxodontisalivarius]|nr:ACT domain-containing protein [Streptococcus loxodontisalivarius]